MEEPVGKDGGKIYWFFYNAGSAIAERFKQHKMGTSLVALSIALVLFLLRAIYHPYVIVVREKSFLLVLVVALIATWIWARQQRTAIKLVASAACIVGLAVLYFWGGAVHDYLSQYYRYRTLHIVELRELPTTGHERLQPLNSIHSLAYEKVASEIQVPQVPDFVGMGNEYRWTLAIEPAHFISKFMGSVEELFSIPGDDPSPDFSKPEQVSFLVGEDMLLGKNSHSATVKTFNPWRFLNYEPVDVSYIRDGAGSWIQVVTLVRWTGIFFPRPEFGGVQLIHQEKPTFLGDIKLMLFGTGEWISPEDVPKYSFLRDENILGYGVSRYMARSFRFQNGFFGPMPGNHVGDVRIPDMPADVNDQPFTTYFDGVGENSGMLYHYFALEPFDPSKQGLSISLFIPADGTNVVYVYKHSEHGAALTGGSAIAEKIMNTRMQYDWSLHRPVEHRPFIRDIAGKRRFFWLTTVVTYKEGTTDADVAAAEKSNTPRRFIAGALPNIVITDAEYNIPVWASTQPGKWVEELLADQTLKTAWIREVK